MPAPLTNLIRAIDAPVSSLRHSIFSWMPLSDFSRHGNEAVFMRISSSAGMFLGSFVIAGPDLCLSERAAERSSASVWRGNRGIPCAGRFDGRLCGRPAHALELDQPRQVADLVAIGQLVHRSHLVHEHGRAERLVGYPLVAEDRLDLVLPAAERYHDIGVVVDVEVEGFARCEIELPNPHEFVLEHDPLANLAELDAPFGGGLDPVLVGRHRGFVHDVVPHYFPMTAIALISIR